MKTKIVYVVASTEHDVYLEQAIVSAWSARYYNPDATIVLVCDQDTNATLQSGIRHQYVSQLFDEVIVREFLPEQGMLERSRWMKTSLRQIVNGDFLFLDSDTVVCADLSEVDQYVFDMGMVLDLNCKFRDAFLYNTNTSRMKMFYGTDISNLDYYFNGGVAFVRDTEKAHKFYELWFNHWKSRKKEANMKDQPALCQTNIEMGYPIVQMSGDMNCQVQVSIQHLHTAKIMHFFSCWRGSSSMLSPFFDNNFYLGIKSDGLTPEIQSLIINCKTSFHSPVCILPGKYGNIVRKTAKNLEASFNLIDSHSFVLLRSIQMQHPRLFLFIEKASNKLNHLLERLH